MEEQEVTDAMQWGTDHEADALAWYETETGELPSHTLGRQIFVAHEEWNGCTPDGFVGTEGLVDFKAPQRMYEEPGLRHYIQLQSQIVCTDRSWADLCVWTPEESRIWRTHRDPRYWELVRPILFRYWEALTYGMEPSRTKKTQMEVKWNRIA